MNQTLRNALPLGVGLLVGAVGAVLFQESLVGEEGSPAEQAAKLEVELKKANRRIALLESDPRNGDRSGRTLKDGARSIGEAIRDGRDVTPDDIFQATQPLLRDLSPLMSRMRVLEEKNRIEQMSGEYARKYDLTPQQQESLKKWFELKSEENAERWSDMITQEGTSLVDLMKESRDVRMDDGLDQFMGNMLTGNKRVEFENDRLVERAERVQEYADRRTQRLNQIVELDPVQTDQVFAIMAKNSSDYNPGMQFDGGQGAFDQAPVGDPTEAMMKVLRPDQVEAFQAERAKRRAEAEEEMSKIGLTLPADWDPLEMEGF